MYTRKTLVQRLLFNKLILNYYLGLGLLLILFFTSENISKNCHYIIISCNTKKLLFYDSIITVSTNTLNRNRQYFVLLLRIHKSNLKTVLSYNRAGI